VLEAFHKAVAKRSGSAAVDASVEWEQLHDSESGNPYWHNVVTDETSWAFMGGDRSSEREAAVSIVTGAARASV
jgi:hypothetical protein